MVGPKVLSAAQGPLEKGQRGRRWTKQGLNGRPSMGQREIWVKERSHNRARQTQTGALKKNVALPVKKKCFFLNDFVAGKEKQKIIATTKKKELIQTRVVHRGELMESNLSKGEGYG